MTVTPLKTVPKASNEDAVQRLEEALGRAKAGEIVAVAIAAVLDNGAISRGWSRADPTGPLIGAVAYLQHELISASENEEGSDAA